ncbi:MAG: histidine ammonia-lyase [Euryarchaeota archaeon]|nr:histidine ammonia-lyase [Euryarchaeota archaeon]|tara:strand:+ start:10855 stop:12375 length:1521 start_codon:yes stop_codon:yes gene_type:complete
MRELSIDGFNLTIEDVIDASRSDVTVTLSEVAMGRMVKSRAVVEDIVEGDEVVYGINTGFGALSSVTINSEDLRSLQENLIRSHACGVGENMEYEHVRMMMLIRANTLCRGQSGARPVVVETLISMINAGICPVIPRIGSLGASGDLAPLSHLALALIGEGECEIIENGEAVVTSSETALNMFGITPIVLEAKEGLSLINGTSQMCAYMCETISNMDMLMFTADLSAACSVEAIMGSHIPFDNRIHDSRPHWGQGISAARIREALSNSDINASHIDCGRVQDAYSFRCVPQVHGPVIDMLREARRITTIEINSATDNPLVFNGDGSILSGGNFHGQYLAMSSDGLALACHEIASISERRTAQILDPQWSGQKPFLAINEGLESGLMIVQYTSAAIVAELHMMASPATTSNVPVSMGKEDHVSMGATGSHRSMKSSRYLAQVIANELICSTEALDRIPEAPGAGVKKVHSWVRRTVPGLTADRAMSKDSLALSNALLSGGITEAFGD